MTTRITGTGRALPQYSVTNEELSRQMDTSDAWIRSRTGIGERRLAGEEEDGVSLAVQAAKAALANAGCAAAEIELIIVATCSSPWHFPSVACQVQAALGISGCAAFDVSAACSGFLFALHTAHAYLESGLYRKALLIGTETLSRVIDWEDRSTCVLFGDGAGACVVEADRIGIVDFVQHAEGSGGACLTAKGAALATPVCGEQDAIPLSMDGQAVFRFAVKTVPDCISQLLQQTETAPEAVTYYVLHQANKRIIQSVAKRLALPEEKFPMNLEAYGNTSAASVPMLLDELNRTGSLQRGDLLLLAAFGAGLTWGATLLNW